MSDEISVGYVLMAVGGSLAAYVFAVVQGLRRDIADVRTEAGDAAKEAKDLAHAAAARTAEVYATKSEVAAAIDRFDAAIERLVDRIDRRSEMDLEALRGVAQQWSARPEEPRRRGGRRRG